ncbi:gpW family protein [Burkholderia contaminans]|uniref:gpW family head-tail joining protein n=1 Tax=Burkholderia TaxID=32008 RepID=UPI0009BD799E|nr:MULTISPECIES: gpW family head-tail joining protein [Burkholderia]MBD1412868.1 phage head-tail adapter protein [Burkholderia contaminans]UXZ68681.1 gpW family protein [Burkholderia contaminans]UXZ76442.1 gpW family protein [Burkholderia contaminans]
MGVYDGLSTTDLQTRLTALQNAYFALSTGQQVASVSYSQGDGAKSVTYRQTDLVRLQADIALIQRKLGIAACGRRPIRFSMR